MTDKELDDEAERYVVATISSLLILFYLRCDISFTTNRLVQWTRDLDFETYRSDWLLLATTAGSDYEVLGVTANQFSEQ